MKNLPLDKITITSPFGMRMHPIEKKKKLHNGVDLLGNIGDKVYAVDNGSVLYSHFVDGAGECVIVKHNGYYSYYCHLSKRNVMTGQIVHARQIIGLVGSTGASTGPHLHFGLAKTFNLSAFSKSDWYDPKPYLEELMVEPKDITAIVNGKSTKLKAIVYQQENYIRLRDLADVDKTDKLIVDWDAAKKQVIIKTK